MRPWRCELPSNGKRQGVLRQRIGDLLPDDLFKRYRGGHRFGLQANDAQPA